MTKQQFSIPSLLAQVPTEADAYELLERLRWEKGIVCPHCASVGKHYFLNPANGKSRATRTGAVSQRRVWKCRDCRKQFSVLTGTIFHGTKIPVRTWLCVIFEMCASKNGVAAREIERKYNLTPKSAWFMTHRIREAMKREPLASLLSGTVVADETWIGGKPGNMHAQKRPRWESRKTPVLSLVDKTTGEVRSAVIPNVRGETLRRAIAEQVDMANTVLHTDSLRGYLKVAQTMKGHESVNHEAGEYVRYDVTTNIVEGFFSQLKRSVDGTHHHVSVEHLSRYLCEFDFRASTRRITDSDRMHLMLGQVLGRRLTYAPLTG